MNAPASFSTHFSFWLPCAVVLLLTGCATPYAQQGLDYYTGRIQQLGGGRPVPGQRGAT